MPAASVNLLVCGHDLKFLTPMIERFRSRPGCEVRILQHAGHHLDDEAAATQALAWADVIFCEWALGNAVWFSQRKRPDQVLIVRLHLQEVQARERIGFIWETDWTKVDRLILITQHVYDWMRQEFPVLAARSALVYNPIPAKSALDRPKSPQSRFVLGLVGVVPARKRLDLAVELLRRLRELDPRYVLRVKGALPGDFAWMAQRQDEMAWYDAVFNGLQPLRDAGAIVFDPHGPDMAAWYAGIGHILSVSDFEGSHQAVAEAMATGAVPAIRDWEGAERIYPARYVASTLDALASLIHAHATPQAFEQASAHARAFAQSRFDDGHVCDKLEAVVQQEMRRIPRLRPGAATLGAAWRALPTVLIVAYIPVGSRGGYRIRVEQEIEILVQQGCRVHLACLVPRPARPPADADEQRERGRAVQAHVQAFAALGCGVHLLEAEDFFRMQADAAGFQSLTDALVALCQAQQVDVIHAEALYCARVAGFVKAALPAVAFSIDWHGVVPEEGRMGGAHEKRVAALEQAEQALLRQADLNVFVSQRMELHYRTKYDCGALRHVTVPCCVSDQRFAGAGDTPVRPGAGAGDGLVFGYAGTMADWQCGPEMVALFAQLHRRDETCRFMLLAPQADQAKVQAYAQQAGLPASAYSVAEVPHDEVPQRLQGCHVGVLLRRDDPVNGVSSPTKFGEYLAAGLPVLMTDCIGDFSSMALEHQVGFVVPSTRLRGDPGEAFGEDVIDGILAFAHDVKARKAAYALRCQSLVRDHLAWEPAAMRWLAAYRDLCA